MTNSHSTKKRLLKALGFSTLGGVIALGYTLALILSTAERTGWSETSPLKPTSLIIVLGMGPTPAHAVLDRSELAAAVWKDTSAMHIVTSGGQGTDEPEPESSTLAKDLLFRGVPPNAIIEESQSKSTYENLINSADLIKRLDLSIKSVAIVTHGFHAARVEAMAAALGYEAYVVTAQPGLRLDHKKYREMREVFALWKWWILGR